MNLKVWFVFFLLVVMLPVGNASEQTDSTLEARNIEAQYLPDMEVTFISWRNIETTDGQLLDDLKTATYEVHRSNTMFQPGFQRDLTMIASDIPACYSTDLNEECSGKEHVLEHYPPPGKVNVRFIYYAVVTILRDGTVTDPVNLAISQTPPGHVEDTAPIQSPQNFTATYDASNKSTHFSWRPACTGSNYNYILYQHNEPATRSTWDDLEKVITTEEISQNVSEYTLDWTYESYYQSIEREVYYTLTCLYPPYCDDEACYPASEDVRFYTDNTLAEPITEDTSVPRYSGHLLAEYDREDSTTSLQWTKVVEKDISSILLYHSTNPIVSVVQENVTVLAELPADSVEFIHQLTPDWMTTSYYALGLVDNSGNVQTNNFDVLGKVGPVLERMLPISITSLDVEIQNSTTLLFSWDIDSRFSQGDAVLWKSEVTTPDLSVAWTEVMRLNPAEGEFYYSVDEVERSWYAITLEGTWGSSSSTHIDNRIEANTNAFYLLPEFELNDETDQEESSEDDKIQLPEFGITLLESNRSIKNGDWITLTSQTNSTHEFSFSSEQNNSTFRWTNALNDNPFWYGATTGDGIFTIAVDYPIKLIHIESTNVNGEIDIVRVGIDWNYVESIKPVEEENQTVTDDKKSSTEEQSVSPILIIMISLMAAYIVFLQVQRRPEKQLSREEE
ncbi:MAG: hypothetical protein L7U53_04695 [Candidatus Poseidoniaceae archaeon]|nr:hypothetical protein [Candidatus Poseidoniaceae archaeon]